MSFSGLAAQLGLSGQLQNYSRGPGSLQLPTAASGSAGIVTPWHQKKLPRGAETPGGAAGRR